MGAQAIDGSSRLANTPKSSRMPGRGAAAGALPARRQVALASLVALRHWDHCARLHLLLRLVRLGVANSAALIVEPGFVVVCWRGWLRRLAHAERVAASLKHDLPGGAGGQPGTRTDRSEAPTGGTGAQAIGAASRQPAGSSLFLSPRTRIIDASFGRIATTTHLQKREGGRHVSHEGAE